MAIEKCDHRTQEKDGVVVCVQIGSWEEVHFPAEFIMERGTLRLVREGGSIIGFFTRAGESKSRMVTYPLRELEPLNELLSTSSEIFPRIRFTEDTKKFF